MMRYHRPSLQMQRIGLVGEECHCDSFICEVLLHLIPVLRSAQTSAAEQMTKRLEHRSSQRAHRLLSAEPSRLLNERCQRRLDKKSAPSVCGFCGPLTNTVPTVF
eukprot:COSAG02_NODE_86_length_39084_cov_17.815724_29_plen_105_part_00